MNYFKYIILLLASLLIISCNANVKNSPSSHQDTNESQLKINSHLYTIPKFFSSAENFQRFVDDKSINEESKYPILENFFEQNDKYSDDTLAEIFADIGSKVKWDVDVINIFAHDMKNTIKKRPQIICKVANQLTHAQMSNYTEFYLGNVIWNDNFPVEFFQLQTCNPQQFKTVLFTFYGLYKQQSTRQLHQKYHINDKDGKTNLREQANTTSAISGTLNNGTIVTPLWTVGQDGQLDKPYNWLFVIQDNKAGYLNIANLKPIP